MFERFTDHARRVVILAREEARMLNHDCIGTEHLLLGLLREGDGVAAQALGALGIIVPELRHQAREVIGQGPRAPAGHLPFTSRGKRVIALSLREALELGQSHVGTEHILLGLIREGRGTATRLLAGLGADLSAARPHVVDLLRRHHRYPGQVPAAAVSWSWAAEPACGKMPEQVVAVQQDMLGQISHDLEDDARFRAEDAGRMARDFLALRLGAEPSALADELAEFSKKYPQAVRIWERHLDFCMTLAGLADERAEQEAATSAGDHARAARARDRERPLLLKKADWPLLYPASGIDPQTDPTAQLERYAQPPC
jgi:hypothetical protein